MPGPSPVELTTDCEACLLEGGLVEVYDPLVAACRFGVPARTYCKLCGVEHRGDFDRPLAREMREIAANRCPGCECELTPAAIDSRACAGCGAAAHLVVLQEPALFTSVVELEDALDRWASREGFPSRRALLAATFVTSDVAQLFAAIASGAALEVLADPFANMGVKTTGKTREPAPARAPAAAATPTAIVERAAPVPATVEPRPRSVPPPPSAPPRALVYPLVSVIAADGEIHPAERELVDRFLKSEGLLPLSEDEYRVHAPAEVARFVPKERREDVVKLMCESACCDGAPDESEKRVIKAYALAWNVDDEKVDFWLWGYESMNTSLVRQLFLKLRRFVLSARWSPDSLGADE